MHPKFDLKLMFLGGRRCLFGVPGVCQTSDRHHHLDKGRKSSFMISCHHCCQRTSSSFTFIFITGKRNRKPESVDWRGSLSNKSCSQERFPVDFQTHKHLSQSNNIMSVDDPTRHWKWFIIITVNLQRDPDSITRLNSGEYGCKARNSEGEGFSRPFALTIQCEF